MSEIRGAIKATQRQRCRARNAVDVVTIHSGKERDSVWDIARRKGRYRKTEMSVATLGARASRYVTGIKAIERSTSISLHINKTTKTLTTGSVSSL